MTLKSKRLAAIVSVVLLLLLIPFTAMQFTNQVNWTTFDFIIAGVLLMGAGLAIEWILMTVKIRKYRLIFSVMVVAILLLIWAEIAVGVFGMPFAGSLPFFPDL